MHSRNRIVSSLLWNLSGTLSWTTMVRRSIRKSFWKSRFVMQLLIFELSDGNAILWSDAKVSKRKSLFSSIRVFVFELVIFFTGSSVKFHHSKFHACKQPRNFVNSLWIRWVTTASQTPLLKDMKTASSKCVTDNYVISFPFKVMEGHIRLLEALCRICGGNIRGKL